MRTKIHKFRGAKNALCSTEHPLEERRKNHCSIYILANFLLFYKQGCIRVRTSILEEQDLLFRTREALPLNQHISFKIRF